MVVRGQSGGAQHRGHGGERHRVVLWREGVYRGRDHRQLGWIEPLPKIEPIREDEGIGALNVGAEEPPGFAREVVGWVDAHVRAPDDRHPCLHQPRDHAGGLRIVQQHDVSGTNALCHQLSVVLTAALVGSALGLAQPTAVARVSVQSVVQALGYPEELGVARDRYPARITATAARVSDQRAQHLGDAAALGGRVDVPERPRLQQLAPAPERMFKARERVGCEHAAQAFGIKRSDGDVLKPHAASIFPYTGCCACRISSQMVARCERSCVRVRVRCTAGLAKPTEECRHRHGKPLTGRERLRCCPVSIRNLESMFNPTHVAVVGAGGERMQLGHIVLRNLVDAGFEGVVYPINRSREAVGGIQAYARIADTPAKAELAIVCTPAATIPEVVRECGEAGVLAIAVLSAGFREIGAEGLTLERAVADELGRHDGMRLLGPNCLGLIVPRLGLNASFAGAMPSDGEIALLSQSGALATSMVDWALAEQVGFSHVVSVGNMLDVDLGDVIDYLSLDRQTRSIILYVESVTNARKFMSAARAAARSKPIIVYKAGRFAASAKAAVSHTGAMAGEDAVYDAAFRRAGLVRVERIEDMFVTAQLLARERRVRGGRLAIVTNAGGPGVMTADALLARNGALAEPKPETLATLDAALPPAWSHANPIDVLGDAPPQRFHDAVKAALADTDVDAVLVILTPQATTDAAGTADAVLAAGRERSKIGQPKPILAAWMGGDSVREGLKRLSAGGVAAYTFPEQAIDAFMDLVSYTRNLETLHETPRTIPVSFALDRGRAKKLMGPVLAEGRGVMSETLSKTLLEAYEIPVTKPLPALTADDAVATAEQIGYPVVLKVRSPEITHKTDVGGVELDVASAAGVRAAYDRIIASVREQRPEAEVQGVTVQPSARTTGHELVLGARKDASFGAVILLGTGGVAAELLRDQALGLPPLNERLALAMLHSLRVWPLLGGYRGRPGVDIDALLEVLMRFSYLVADYPEISEIDINPLLAGMDGAIALDARVVVDESLVGRPPPPPFSHLAIRPYPEEYERKATTSGGLTVTMRAIKPEDEPLWHEMLDACSPESIHMRFRSLVKHTHEMATRYCFIDYDRELAIVAELEAEDGARKLLGVGRLVADPDHQGAEYAVLVADPWQGRGLSDLLTDYCLEIAQSWGIRVVRAETTPDNARMLAVLKEHGFTLTRRVEEGIVVGERPP